MFFFLSKVYCWFFGGVLIRIKISACTARKMISAKNKEWTFSVGTAPLSRGANEGLKREKNKNVFWNHTTLNWGVVKGEASVWFCLRTDVEWICDELRCCSVGEPSQQHRRTTTIGACGRAWLFVAGTVCIFFFYLVLGSQMCGSASFWVHFFIYLFLFLNSILLIKSEPVWWRVSYSKLPSEPGGPISPPCRFPPLVEGERFYLFFICTV